MELERVEIAHEFCIGFFAEHHDRDIGLGGKAAVRGQLGCPARRLHAVGDAAVNGVGMREIGVAQIAAALPADRPAAGLHGDAIRAIAGDQHALPGFQRQEVAIVFEQHERFTHRAPRKRTMFRACEQLDFTRQRAR